MSRKTFRGIEGYLSSSAHLVLRWAKKQWKSGKLILQGKEYAFISPDGSSELGFLFGRPASGEPPVQNRDEKTQPPGGKNSNTGPWRL